MANTINIPRTHLIMGLCLPLAVLLGFFMAEPMDSASLTVVIIVLAVLSIPLMMKWHHPLLVFSWNAIIVPQFLPGRPALWMIMAAGSLFFAMLNRSVRSTNKFIHVPSLTKSLLFFLGVVVVTALTTGGLGFKAFGSEHFGGKGYYFIFGAIAGYFALTSQRIPAERVGLYLGMFFLPAIFGLAANVIYTAGPRFYFLFQLFPAQNAMEQATGENAMFPTWVRITGFSVASPGLYCYLLARHGIRGVLDISKPGRMFFFFLATAACFAGGYRSVVILFMITLMVLFYLEGLHRTRWLPLSLGLALLGAAVLLPLADRLPLIVQRSLSFLPAKMNPIVALNAAGNSEWRIQMWQLVLPQVPKYLLKGKGYALDPSDLYMAQESMNRNFSGSFEESIVAGDYHNGPLSIIIPFGIAGVIGFVWFLNAAIRFMYHHYRYGPTELKHANTFLLAAFIAKLVLFVFVFGSLYSDLVAFTGLIGLSVSLNGPIEAPVESEAAEAAWESVPLIEHGKDSAL